MGASTARTRGPTAVEHFLHTEYKEDSVVKEELMTQLKHGECMKKNRMSNLRTEASKSMAARGEEFVKRMEEEAKVECQRRAEKAKDELEGLRNPSDALKLQYVFGFGITVMTVTNIDEDLLKV
jgi:hypothetical protein